MCPHFFRLDELLASKPNNTILIAGDTLDPRPDAPTFALDSTPAARYDDDGGDDNDEADGQERDDEIISVDNSSNGDDTNNNNNNDNNDNNDIGRSSNNNSIGRVNSQRTPRRGATPKRSSVKRDVRELISEGRQARADDENKRRRHDFDMAREN